MRVLIRADQLICSRLERYCNLQPLLKLAAHELGDSPLQITDLTLTRRHPCVHFGLTGTGSRIKSKSMHKAHERD